MGIYDGMRFTDAKALVPDLGAEPVDRNQNKEALIKLVEWMVRWSPITAIDGEEALLMETTGCDHLHDGEENMLHRLSEQLSKAHIPHRLGLAGTPGAASALARFARGKAASLLKQGQEKEGLQNLPVRALGISEEASTMLRRFGLTRIGQLYNIDRKTITKRFQSAQESSAVIVKLDELLGIRSKPLRPHLSPPSFIERLSCPEPIATTLGITIGLEKLGGKLCKQLESYGKGGRHFTLRAFKSDGTASAITVTTAAPITHNNHLLRLFKERIDTIDPGYGIDFLTLEARRIDILSIAIAPLSAALNAQSLNISQIAALADRLTAKLGAQAVTVQQIQETHIPEKTLKSVPFTGCFDAPPYKTPCKGRRPLRLFRNPERINVLATVPDGPPKRFVWRRINRTVIRAEGPERIAPEWWRKEQSPKNTRDYYRVEDERGRRYWVFRDGLYGATKTIAPAWYVHGLFS